MGDCSGSDTKQLLQLDKEVPELCSWTLQGKLPDKNYSVLVPRRTAPVQQWAFCGNTSKARASPNSGRPTSPGRPASTKRRSMRGCDNSHTSTGQGQIEDDILEQTMRALQEKTEEVVPICCWCGLQLTPGHRESCALRPAPCRHCNQWISLAALAPHEDVCPKGRAAQHEQQSSYKHSRHLLSRKGRTPAGCTFNPASSQKPCLVDDWGRTVAPALTASDTDSGSLPPLSSRTQAPLAKVPLPSHSERFSRPQRRASCQPLSQSMRRQLVPPPPVPEAHATARGITDQEETVPSVDELRLQVQRERRKYIETRKLQVQQHLQLELQE